MTTRTQATERLQGTLDLLILRTITTEPMHGWGISQRLQEVSRDVFQINQGSLYPALHRMEDKGWVRAEWRTSEHNRRARYYSLTAAGQRQLERERSSWSEFATAVTRVLRYA